jgi:hypothetical protein
MLDDNSHGGYGVDYIGLGAVAIASAQQYSPYLSTPTSSCTIKYPQKMVINSETVSGTEIYGGQQTGFNLLVLTITPTNISVARGGASTPPRVLHF